MLEHHNKNQTSSANNTVSNIGGGNSSGALATTDVNKKGFMQHKKFTSYIQYTHIIDTPTNAAAARGATGRAGVRGAVAGNAARGAAVAPVSYHAAAVSRRGFNRALASYVCARANTNKRFCRSKNCSACESFKAKILDVPLQKLLQSMSIAYRQNLTSPKWNRFKGLRLRWKDKIRLNNVIWRCWHMQFVKQSGDSSSSSKLLCQFANPLEIDHHKEIECSSIVTGKYWKRKMETIKNEYLRWRCYLLKDGDESGTDLKPLARLVRSTSFNNFGEKAGGVERLQDAKIKWDRDRGGAGGGKSSFISPKNIASKTATSATSPSASSKSSSSKMTPSSSTASAASAASTAATSSSSNSSAIATTSGGGGGSNQEGDSLDDFDFDAFLFNSPFKFVEGSKDDAAMDSLLTDEAFMADAYPFDTSNVDDMMMSNLSNNVASNSVAQGSASHQGVAMFDMGGDDYKNRTNSDFIIPGLPSLQPNLDEIGVVDFGSAVFKGPSSSISSSSSAHPHRPVAAVHPAAAAAAVASGNSAHHNSTVAPPNSMMVTQQLAGNSQQQQQQQLAGSSQQQQQQLAGSSNQQQQQLQLRQQMQAQQQQQQQQQQQFGVKAEGSPNAVNTLLEPRAVPQQTPQLVYQQPQQPQQQQQQIQLQQQPIQQQDQSRQQEESFQFDQKHRNRSPKHGVLIKHRGYSESEYVQQQQQQQIEVPDQQAPSVDPGIQPVQQQQQAFQPVYPMHQQQLQQQPSPQQQLQQQQQQLYRPQPYHVGPSPRPRRVASYERKVPQQQLTNNHASQQQQQPNNAKDLVRMNLAAAATAAAVVQQVQQHTQNNPELVQLLKSKVVNMQQHQFQLHQQLQQQQQQQQQRQIDLVPSAPICLATTPLAAAAQMKTPTAQPQHQPVSNLPTDLSSNNKQQPSLFRFPSSPATGAPPPAAAAGAPHPIHPAASVGAAITGVAAAELDP